MINTVPDILSRIVEHKKRELAGKTEPLSRLEQRAQDCVSSRRDFHLALQSSNPAVIAEFKRASPSKGNLSAGLTPATVAAEYEAGGAAAMSVLTDAQFFQGSFEDLEAARDAMRLPVLRKDFTIDSYDVVEAAAHGADAILLIAAILSGKQMRDLRELAATFGMSALVEVHNAEELEPALDSGAQIVGVNNRNLHTFEVSLETSLRLAERMPDHVARVSESGIHGRADIDQLLGAGYRAFLVGEHLMRAGNPCQALRELIG